MAGTLTVSTTEYRGVTKYSLAWTSDASGNVSGSSFSVRQGELLQVGFVPGSGGNQPTDLYDMTIADANGIDILAGGGANLSNASATQAVPVVSTYFRRILEAGSLTPSISNAGNAKSGTIVLLVR